MPLLVAFIVVAVVAAVLCATGAFAMLHPGFHAGRPDDGAEIPILEAQVIGRPRAEVPHRRRG